MPVSELSSNGLKDKAGVILCVKWGNTKVTHMNRKQSYHSCSTVKSYFMLILPVKISTVLNLWKKDISICD